MLVSKAMGKKRRIKFYIIIFSSIFCLYPSFLFLSWPQSSKHKDYSPQKVSASITFLSKNVVPEKFGFMKINGHLCSLNALSYLARSLTDRYYFSAYCISLKDKAQYLAQLTTDGAGGNCHYRTLSLSPDGHWLSAFCADTPFYDILFDLKNNRRYKWGTGSDGVVKAIGWVRAKLYLLYERFIKQGKKVMLQFEKIDTTKSPSDVVIVRKIVSPFMTCKDQTFSWEAPTKFKEHLSISAYEPPVAEISPDGKIVAYAHKSWEPRYAGENQCEKSNKVAVFWRLWLIDLKTGISKEIPLLPGLELNGDYT